MPEEVVCNLCGSNDAETLYVLRDYRFFVDQIEWPMVKCRDCGMGYLNPRPSRQEIGRYYPTRYFDHRDRLETRYHRQASYIGGPPGRLLDIGAANGNFLTLMRKRGWDVEGIEPFADTDDANGLVIHRSPFPDECQLPAQRFDVITAWAVFEHMHDPAKAFAECTRLLRTGGRLVVEVPNLQSIRGRFAPLEDVPRHLHFFSPKTLAAYGRRSGLELESVAHVTNLFSGASGRDALRYWVSRALGKSIDDFNRIYRTPRDERFRQWPYTSVALSTAGLVGRVLIPDWFVRIARISGEIVVVYRRDESALHS
jgi:SAM-dependent methyltransferase